MGYSPDEPMTIIKTQTVHQEVFEEKLPVLSISCLCELSVLCGKCAFSNSLHSPLPGRSWKRSLVQPIHLSDYSSNLLNCPVSRSTWTMVFLKRLPRFRIILSTSIVWSVAIKDGAIAGTPSIASGLFLLFLFA